MDLDFKSLNNPNLGIREKQGYFLREGKHLFYAEYLPAGETKAGVVLCAPFAEEKVRTMRIYVSFARALASQGVAALYFDYFGDGDSEGDFEQAAFEDRLKDIKAAVNEFKNRNLLDKIGLLGLRWGATLATLSAEKLHSDILILWEPVVDSAKYFYDHLRAYLASQMLIEGKATRTREELVQDMKEGGMVTAEGYNLAGRLYFGAVENSFKGRPIDFSGKTLIVQIAANPDRIRPELEVFKTAFPDAELKAVPREFEWEKTETWQPSPPRLFSETLDFMERNGFLRRSI